MQMPPPGHLWHFSALARQQEVTLGFPTKLFTSQHLYCSLASAELSQQCGEYLCRLWNFIQLNRSRAIYDSDGPKVADKFYKHLFKVAKSADADNGKCPNTMKAALSLHYAVTQLHSEMPNFVHWVPFVLRHTWARSMDQWIRNPEVWISEHLDQRNVDLHVECRLDNKRYCPCALGLITDNASK
jgi:hypothetical protein